MSRFGQPSTTRPSTVVKRSYFTEFGLTENPISEGGLWIRRSLGWAPVITASGRAYGAQNVYSGTVTYDDSYAYLSGEWSPNIEIITEQYNASASGIVESEHLHRVNDVASSGGNVQCYEFNWNPEGDYCNWYRWHGAANDPDNDYTVLATSTIAGGVQDGHYIRTRVIGNVLTAWIDRRGGAGWQQLLTATDTEGAGGGAFLTSGAPGQGFYWEVGATVPSTFGHKWIQVREL